MTETPKPKALPADEMLAELRRLVEALDRRVPRLKHLGEEKIAREAADLRARALSLIREIEEKRPGA